MKFEITREWLAEKLAHCDDASAGAGGTPLEKFKKEIEQRTVTPAGGCVKTPRSRLWTRGRPARLLQRIDFRKVAQSSTPPEFDVQPSFHTGSSETGLYVDHDRQQDSDHMRLAFISFACFDAPVSPSPACISGSPGRAIARYPHATESAAGSRVTACASTQGNEAQACVNSAGRR